MLNPTEHEASTAHKNLNTDNERSFFNLSLSGVVFIMLINDKIHKVIGIWR